MAKMTKKRANEILDTLETAYPQAGCALDHQDPFELLIAVVLSAQTTDKSVNQVTPALYEAYPDAAALSRAEQADVEEKIHRIGMYRTKAKNIIALSKQLVELYGGEVPAEQDKLEALPGVGRKTANVVMAEAFGAQRIAVDTHVFRVSNRIGLVSAADVAKTEEGLKKILPEHRWTKAHHLLIWHGRLCCHARRPNCEGCPILALCDRKNVEK